MTARYFFLGSLRTVSACLFLSMFCSSAFAWWNDEWPYRTPIVVDASITGANITGAHEQVTLLLKLHPGNFNDFFLLNENLGDLRFVANDDVTPLKHHVEHFDQINQLLYVWVKVPKLSGGINTEKIWMYYGNQTAVNNADPAGSYDADTALVYHFKTDEQLPTDATAYGANASEFTGQIVNESLIAAGVSFDGTSYLSIPDRPAFAVNADIGATVSFWFEPSGLQENATIVERSDGNRSLAINVDGNNIYATLESTAGESYRTPDATVVSADSWQQVTLVLASERMSLYVDGNEVASTPITLEPLGGSWLLGNTQEGGRPYRGELDEFRIDAVARSAGWVQIAIATQGVMANLLQPQPAEQLGSAGESGMLTVLLTSMGSSGWTVVFLLMIMAAISWAVMVGKLVYVSQVWKQNKKFLNEYRRLGDRDPTELDHKDDPEDDNFDNAPIVQALFGRHDHFQSSSIYRLYHRGVQELQSRVGSTVGAQAAGLRTQTIDVIKASLDAQMIREVQRLNSQMVLLTIAISGGPFLGLLGTVLGVMITFASIAITGDVNISAIAPGVAAALLTTVAGLIVAIPALFGYNYLATRIKESIADLRVFSDEFVTRIAEYYGR